MSALSPDVSSVLVAWSDAQRVRPETPVVSSSTWKIKECRNGNFEPAAQNCMCIEERVAARSHICGKDDWGLQSQVSLIWMME
jgi:hypothetical protein